MRLVRTLVLPCAVLTLSLAGGALAQPMTRVVNLAGPRLLASGDFNSDGRVDVVMLEDPGLVTRQISVRDAGTGILWARTAEPSNSLPSNLQGSGLTFVDLDEDSRFELLFLDQNPSEIRCFEVPALGALPPPSPTTMPQQWSFTYPTTGTATSFAPLFASFDGVKQYLLHPDNTGSPVWRIRDATGGLVQTITPTSAPVQVELWNVDSDAATEIAFIASGGGTDRLEVYRWTAPTAASPFVGGGPMLRLLSANPARSQTTLGYSVPTTSDVELVVHDLQGRRVRELARGRAEAGTYEVRWEGDDDDGRAVPTGTYFVELRTAGTRVGRKLVWIR